MKANGFDAVRLGVTGTGLMPQPGVIDEQLLDRIAETVNVLTAHHLYVLLDIHQDGWGERANGEPLGSDGFPEWMTLTNGATNTHTDFPLYYVTNPAIPATFQSLWDNVDGPDGVSLQTSVAKMFGTLAAHFGRNPESARLRLLQRTVARVRLDPLRDSARGCPDQDHASLDPLYAKVTNAIRASIAGTSCSANRSCCSTSACADRDEPAGRRHAERDELPPLRRERRRPNRTSSRRALDWSAATGGALLNTEWGATDDTAAITRARPTCSTTR